MPQAVTFYLLAALAVASALFVVLTKRPTYGVLSLVVTMFSLSGLFVLLHAHFIAMIQILIYAGAILVLFLFILMLIGIEGTAEPEKSGKSILTVLLTVLFISGISTMIWATKQLLGETPRIDGTVEEVGRSLFSEHLLAFEITSFILLVAVVGVITISRREDEASI